MVIAFAGALRQTLAYYAHLNAELFQLDAGGHFRGAGTGGHFQGEGTGESEAPSGLDGTSGDDGERRGAFRTPAQSPSQSNPPPCPAVPEVESVHPQPRCRGRSSTPCSHRPRLAPSWWALSPALAPGLTGWAQLPGQSSAQLLGFALACRSWREMALCHRWARADAPRGDGGLGSGSGVDLARSSSGETVRGDLFLARVHSTKTANSARGPSLDDSALHAVLRLAS